MVRTKKGSIGLVPGSAEKGDSIVIFQGAKVPHVIRPKEGGEESDNYNN